MSSPDDRIRILEDRLDSLEDLVCRTRTQQRKLYQFVDVAVLAAIAFFGLLLLFLISLRIEYGGVTYAVPIEAIAKTLEVPIIASGITAVTMRYLKRFEKP